MQILDVDKKDRKKKKYFTNELRRRKLRSRIFFLSIHFINNLLVLS